MSETASCSYSSFSARPSLRRSTARSSSRSCPFYPGLHRGYRTSIVSMSLKTGIVGLPNVGKVCIPAFS